MDESKPLPLEPGETYTVDSIVSRIDIQPIKHGQGGVVEVRFENDAVLYLRVPPDGVTELLSSADPM